MTEIVSRLIYLLLALSISEPGTAESLIDARGRALDLAMTPQRIASTSLAGDEVLLELLSRRGSLKNLVALSSLVDNAQYSNVTAPPAIRTRLGGELESLFATKPDLVVLASYNRGETIAQIDAAKIRSYVIPDFRSLADIEANITAIGKLVHASAQADALVAELHAAIDRARRLAKHDRPPKILHIASDGVVSAGNTLFDDMTQKLGAENVAAAKGLKGWPRVNAEVLATWDPDWLIVSGEEKDRASTLALLQTRPGISAMAATKKGRILLIPERQLTSVSHHVAKALLALAEGLSRQ